MLTDYEEIKQLHIKEDQDNKSMSPLKKTLIQKEKKLNQLKFVMVPKKEYDHFRDLKQIKEETKTLMLSDNIRAT